jgi:hypothetical protein
VYFRWQLAGEIADALVPYRQSCLNWTVEAPTPATSLGCGSTSELWVTSCGANIALVWLRNAAFTWQAMFANHNATPPAVGGCTVPLPVLNGSTSYSVHSYDVASGTGTLVSASAGSATSTTPANGNKDANGASAVTDTPPRGRTSVDSGADAEARQGRDRTSSSTDTVQLTVPVNNFGVLFLVTADE